MPGELAIRTLGVDDAEQLVGVRRRSFGPSGGDSVEDYLRTRGQTLEQGRVLGVLDGDRVVASSRVLDQVQVWGGRPVPMGGVAGVVVDPDVRGRGVGSLLMRATIARARGLGHVLSALYPATIGIYRQLGWEVVGVQPETTLATVALRALRTPTPDVHLRPAEIRDVEQIRRLEAEHHARARSSGPLLPTGRDWSQDLADASVFTYLGERGFVSYGWEGGGTLRVHRLAAADEATLRALWAVVGSGSSTASTVRVCLPAHDPLHLVAGDAAGTGTHRRWMLRHLDLAAAVAARGFAAGSHSIPLRTVDPEVEAQSGSWRLEVQDGRGRLVGAANDDDAPTVSPRGAAGLYAGLPCAALRLAGQLTGPSAYDAALDAAFATSAAHLLDYF